MTFPEVLRLALVLIADAACLVFIVGYHIKRRGDWRRYPMGRHMMLIAASLALVLTLVVLTLTTGPISIWLWNVVLLPLAAVLIQRAVYVFHRPMQKGVEGPSDDTIRRQRRR